MIGPLQFSELFNESIFFKQIGISEGQLTKRLTF